MSKLSDAGRIFYGIAMSVLGFITIYYHDIPYMMLPPHEGMPRIAMLSYIFGAMLILAGTSIVFKINIAPISIALATVLLLIFCFYFIPYEFFISPDHLHFGDWENAAKELALASGALVIAGCFPKKSNNRMIIFLTKLIPLGTILFAITIISFSIDHFLYANEAADYVPAWIPYHLFWLYFTGTALLGSGIAIILKIKRSLMAALLGAMILIWFIILHMPRVITAVPADLGSEVTSAMLALAYCGIAFVIAGNTEKK